MTLQKAIEILAAYKAGKYEDEGPDLDDAMGLGIRAIERIQWLRSQLKVIATTQMPNETKD